MRMVQARSLIIAEDKDRVLFNRPSQRAAELVLVERFTFRGKEVARIQFRITQKLEAASMKGISTGLGDGVHYTTRVVAVLRVEVVGQNAEFFKRIDVRDDQRAAVLQLLHVCPVYQESVCVFPLTGDRLVAGI